MTVCHEVACESHTESMCRRVENTSEKPGLHIYCYCVRRLRDNSIFFFFYHFSRKDGDEEEEKKGEELEEEEKAMQKYSIC